jgi:uncharacterized protein (TIGR03382 family)
VARALPCIVALACLALAPPALALELDIEPSGGDADSITIIITVRAPCEEVVRAAGADARMAVDLTVTTGHPEVQASGPSPVYLDAAPCPPGASAEANATWVVAWTDTAPALQEILVKVAATGERAVAGPLTEDSSGIVSLTIAPRVAIEMVAPEPDRSGGPQNPLAFEIHVRNLSNCDVQVVFTLAGDIPEEWSNVVVPPPLPLAGLGSGGPTEDVAVLTVNTPYENGPNSDDVELRVGATPYCTLDQRVSGPAVEVSLRASSSGWYIPGPGPLLAAAVLALAAVFARRRVR